MQQNTFVCIHYSCIYLYVYSAVAVVDCFRLDGLTRSPIASITMTMDDNE